MTERIMRPCGKKCGHADCAELREIAKSRCSRCGKKIEYDQQFYHNGYELDFKAMKRKKCYTHEICAEKGE